MQQASGDAFNRMHRLELAWRSQVAAMSCNTTLQKVPADVLEETWNNYRPGTRRPHTLMEWRALLRRLGRLEASYRTCAATDQRRLDGKPA